MFRTRAEDEKTKARAGILSTAHGDLKTPAFLPVATKGAVKTLTPDEVRRAGVDAIIVNSFHFLLRGREAVQKAGGIHDFMRWDGIIFTDCGGFQLIRKDFSFRLSDNGLSFKLMDGSPYVLDPPASVKLQEELGSDVAFALDDCPPLKASEKRVLLSTGRTTKWAEESIRVRSGALFGIVQGGLMPTIREEHARTIAAMDFDGYGIGGLGLGEPREQTLAMTAASLRGLPREAPKHLLGIGSIADLKRHVALGVDIFDSAFPTRNARHGSFFSGTETEDIRKRAHEGSERPLERGCECYTCTEFTRGYIHHLYREKEMLSMRLLSIHNLYAVERLMGQMRTSLHEGTFS